MACNHWTDAEMIDYILGKSKTEEKHSILLDIDSCSHCRSQYLLWKETIPLNSQQEPSLRLKNRVLFNYQQNVRKKKVVQPPIFWKTAGVLIAATLLFFTFLAKDSNQEKISHQVPHTALYEMIAPEPTKTSGYVLVNNQSDEFYLQIEGLLPIMNMDYQAWIKTNRGFHDIGVVQLTNGKGKIYIKKNPSEKVEYILMSIEPKGGSSYPTTENSYLIHLIAK